MTWSLLSIKGGEKILKERRYFTKVYINMNYLRSMIMVILFIIILNPLCTWIRRKMFFLGFLGSWAGMGCSLWILGLPPGFGWAAQLVGYLGWLKKLLGLDLRCATMGIKIRYLRCTCEGRVIHQSLPIVDHRQKVIARRSPIDNHCKEAPEGLC